MAVNQMIPQVPKSDMSIPVDHDEEELDLLKKRFKEAPSWIRNEIKILSKISIRNWELPKAYVVGDDDKGKKGMENSGLLLLKTFSYSLVPTRRARSSTQLLCMELMKLQSAALMPRRTASR